MQLIDVEELKKVLEVEPLNIKTDGSIDRKAVIDFLSGITNLDPKVKGSLVMYVMSLPDIQPERKTGKWVAVGECYVKCSECGLETTKNELRGIALFGENEPYFCPNCGADMREENES